MSRANPSKQCHRAPGNGQWDSGTLPHCMGQWSVGYLLYTCILPRCTEAVGSGTPLGHSRTIGGSEQWDSTGTLLHACRG